MPTTRPTDLITVTRLGHTFKASRRTVAWLDYAVAQLAKDHPSAQLVIIQTCYNTGVAASAGTHDYDACFDLRITGMPGSTVDAQWLAGQQWLRAHGFWCWWRHTGTWAAASEWHFHGFVAPADGRAFATKVGEYVDGGVTRYGHAIASSQIADFRNHAFGLANEHTAGSDRTWYPANLGSTIFDYDAWHKTHPWPQDPQDEVVAILNIATANLCEQPEHDKTVAADLAKIIDAKVDVAAIQEAGPAAYQDAIAKTSLGHTRLKAEHSTPIVWAKGSVLAAGKMSETVLTKATPGVCKTRYIARQPLHVAKDAKRHKFIARSTHFVPRAWNSKGNATPPRPKAAEAADQPRRQRLWNAGNKVLNAGILADAKAGNPQVLGTDQNRNRISALPKQVAGYKVTTVSHGLDWLYFVDGRDYRWEVVSHTTVATHSDHAVLVAQVRLIKRATPQPPATTITKEKQMPLARLGKRDPRPFDPARDLVLDKHLDTSKKAIAALPATFGWNQVKGVNWKMFLNDQLGDCTAAGVAHAVMLERKVTTGKTPVITNNQVRTFYSATSGYVPGDESTDNGAYEVDVLNAWQTDGFAGHKITAHGVIDWHDTAAVKQAIATLGFVYIGLQMPKAWLTGPATWGVPKTKAASEIEGGHCVILIGWDTTGFWLVSWGQVYKITYAAFTKYCDEVHGVVSDDWVAKNGISPTGLNLAGLLTDLAELDNGLPPSSAAATAADPVEEGVVTELIDGVEQWAEGLVYRIPSRTWRSIGSSVVYGLGAAALAAAGAAWKHLSGTDITEAAIAAFLGGTVLKHLPGGSAVTPAELIAIEGKILADVEHLIATRQGTVA